jgi:hypothetical protein
MVKQALSRLDHHHHHVTQSSHNINAIGPAPLWREMKREHCSLKSKVNLRMAAATWVLSSYSLVLAHTVKYYNQEATRFGLFTLHQASILCKQTEPTNTRHQCESNSRMQVFG